MRPLNPPSPSRQLGFHQLLVAARKKYFMDAMSQALTTLDQRQIKASIADYVPSDVQKKLAGAGLRDEYVFPLPDVIETRACHQMIQMAEAARQRAERKLRAVLS
ncbi:MAG: XcyI family restriction endonuclease [Candidatus Dormibacteria bacterium]